MASIPQHVAIIMDGNGRWARQRGMERTQGHRAGAEAIVRCVEAASAEGVRYLSLFAFSTENWSRPEPEVDAILKLFTLYIRTYQKEMSRQGLRVRISGDLSGLTPVARRAAQSVTALTQNNGGMTLNICFGYGGRLDIVRAARLLAADVKSGALSPEDIDNAAFERRLYTEGMPDVDLMIRTSGEKRISNFMLYQLAYAEFVFIDDYWPDFTKETLRAALDEFASRKRRYGGVDSR